MNSSFKIYLIISPGFITRSESKYKAYIIEFDSSDPYQRQNAIMNLLATLEWDRSMFFTARFRGDFDIKGRTNYIVLGDLYRLHSTTDILKAHLYSTSSTVLGGKNPQMIFGKSRLTEDQEKVIKDQIKAFNKLKNRPEMFIDLSGLHDEARLNIEFEDYFRHLISKFDEWYKKGDSDFMIRKDGKGYIIWWPLEQDINIYEIDPKTSKKVIIGSEPIIWEEQK